MVFLRLILTKTFDDSEMTSFQYVWREVFLEEMEVERPFDDVTRIFVCHLENEYEEEAE